ncbi:MAG TPA: hypothetical protein VJ804_11820, partial [Acidimicrobiales bacterium]|nr:hypothetical protein [Acidimicrobiales bacterium]
MSRSSLLNAKLVALARPHLEVEPAVAEFPGGGALVAGDQAWVLLEESPVTRFGPALVWADRQAAAEVHLVVAADVAGVIARRASCFAPAPFVWGIEGTGLVQVRASAGDWSPAPAPAAPELAELLVDADLEVLVEDGIVRGEVQGLEVARIVHGATTTGEPIDEPLLEVGVGQADRELTGMLHAGLSPIDKLARVAEIVRAHRRPDAEPHPLNKLVPERWLRARLVADPGRIGLRELRPVPAAVPRTNLRDKGVAMAQGATEDGAPVVVA